MALPTTLKTPGVYIDEKNAFPNSIVAVETAIPAFFGYTEKAEFGGKPLKNKPVRIESFMEYELFFGSGFQTKYDLNDQNPTQDSSLKPDFRINGTEYWLSENKDKGPSKFNLYDALKFFYQNGGGSCYIVSVGYYTDTGTNAPFSSTQPFMDGIDLLKKETEPTMLVIPDAVLFEQNSCYSLQEHMLMHCGEQMNRVAILDIWEGYRGLENPNFNPISDFRDQVSSDFFSYGAAYYPWLSTTIVQASEINHKNLSDAGRTKLVTICQNAISNLKGEKKAATSNYISLINEAPPTLTMRQIQNEIDTSPSTKVLQLTNLVKSRITAESELLDALAIPDTEADKGTKVRAAGKVLEQAKSNYASFLGDSKNDLNINSSDSTEVQAAKTSMQKIVDAISKGNSSLDAKLKTAKPKAITALEAANKLPDGTTAQQNTKATAITNAKEIVSDELDKVYKISTTSFVAPVLTEFTAANSNLNSLTTELSTATANRETYINAFAADPKTFTETANYELADAKDGLQRAKQALQAANDLSGDPTANPKKKAIADATANVNKYQSDLTTAKDKINIARGNPDPAIVSNALSIAIPEFKLVMEHLLQKKNLMAPSAAMAGIYTLVDSERGVWKAPANVAVSSVVSPSVLIDYEQQEDLNAPLQGKAVCAIRPFKGIGTMVWGARTMDANSLDWRYMNVRRTMIMLEQSIKIAAKAYVFEPNVKNTWVSIEAMISNFLTNLWKLGALAGAVPTDAFSVTVGLGATMTATDILEGRMNIEVRVAISHPAEFIVITFQQQQQKS